MNDTPTSPLLEAHERAGARMVDFAGWQMPLRFTSDLEEHQAVRAAAGIFDLSHMGQVEVIGPDAGALLDRSLVGLCSTMAVGRAKYTMMVDAEGGILDDLIVYRLADNEFLVIPNGANRVRVVGELTRRSSGQEAAITDHTLSRGLIAIQGPRSAEMLQQFVDTDLSEIRYYRCQPATLTIDGQNIPTLLARTGYTGEDGFEISITANDAPRVWEALSALEGVARCGLAARDSLRLEAGMPLYGNELSQEVTPYDVDMGRLVHLDHDFVGRDALAERSQGAHDTVIGLTGEGRRAARSGSEVYVDGERVGVITSGILAPTLGHPIAMARVSGSVPEGTAVDVDVRGRMFPMTVAGLPFYKRPQA